MVCMGRRWFARGAQGSPVGRAYATQDRRMLHPWVTHFLPVVNLWVTH